MDYINLVFYKGKIEFAMESFWEKEFLLYACYSKLLIEEDVKFLVENFGWYGEFVVKEVEGLYQIVLIKGPT